MNIHLLIKIGKLGGRVFDLGVFNALPDASKRYLIRYGAQQAMDDSTASATAKAFPDPVARQAAATKGAEKRFAQIMSGNVPGTTEVDVELLRRVAVAEKSRRDGLTEEEMAAALDAAVAKKARTQKAA